MLAIRLQRTGRSGHAQFRMIVQDSRFSPTRGRVVAYLGSYDPHTKTTTIDGEKASQYLSKGAQPSDRVARLMKKEGIKLPNWVKLEEPQKGATRNPAKRRSTRPPEPKAPEPAVIAEETPAEAPVEAVDAAPEPSAEEAAPETEAPAEEPAPAEAEPEASPAEEVVPAEEAPAESAEAATVEDKPAEEPVA